MVKSFAPIDLVECGFGVFIQIPQNVDAEIFHRDIMHVDRGALDVEEAAVDVLYLDMLEVQLAPKRQADDISHSQIHIYVEEFRLNYLGALELGGVEIFEDAFDASDFGKLHFFGKIPEIEWTRNKIGPRIPRILQLNQIKIEIANFHLLCVYTREVRQTHVQKVNRCSFLSGEVIGTQIRKQFDLLVHYCLLYSLCFGIIVCKCAPMKVEIVAEAVEECEVIVVKRDVPRNQVRKS